MDKISIQELTDIIAQQTGQTKKFSEQFLRELVSVISEYLVNDGLVKVKGLGTFKVITVEERKSVDVTTGREIVLPAHSKVQFIPEESVKQTINEPYSHLETTVLDNPVSERYADAKPAEPEKPKEQEKPKTEKPEPVKPKTEEPVEPAPVEPEQPETVEPEPEKPKAEKPAKQKPEPEKKPEYKSDNEEDENKGSNSIWWWLGSFVLLDLLLILYFTMPNWKPAIMGAFGSDDTDPVIVDTLSEEEELAKEQAYADSLLAIADSMLFSYQDSISNAIADEYTSEPVKEAVKETEPAKEPEKAKEPAITFDNYDYKMAMNAPVREVVTVIDGSRLTMVAYRAYGHKDFWVYVYDANRDVLRRPSGIAKGMSLKIADLPAELVDPKSEEALAKAHELAKKYSN